MSTAIVYSDRAIKTSGARIGPAISVTIERNDSKGAAVPEREIITVMERAELASLERSLPRLRRQRWAGKGDKDAHDNHNNQVARVKARIAELKRKLQAPSKS
jgi:hypothetical protein